MTDSDPRPKADLTASREAIDRIDAEFVRRLGDKVVLKLNSDGRLYTVPLSRLSAEDQKYVEALPADKPGSGILARYQQEAQALHRAGSAQTPPPQ